MPLVRLELRNEYALGAEELYKAQSEDDPKALLEGVAVAGLVGILRQLGDLAEFAAEVFHGLQEQVVTTAARSHKILVRVQHIEAALPPLEKAVLGQKSHIHFAYTAGCNWHPKIRTKQKHFIHSDLPTFIMDSYEECRDPPSLHLLDKFDIGGPGACLQRYSDPSFFRKALNSSRQLNSEKEQRERKAHRIKKKPLRRRNGQVSHAMPISQCNGSFPFASPKSYGQSSVGKAVSTIHMRSKSELGDRPSSVDSGSRSGYIECVFDGTSSMQYEDQEHNRLPTSMLQMPDAGVTGSIPPDEQERGAFDFLAQGSLQESNSSSVTWDEKTEIVKPENHQMDNTTADEGEAAELLPVSPEVGKLESKDTVVTEIESEGVLFSGEKLPDSLSERSQFDGAGSEPEKYMDALNTLDTEGETDSECQTKQEVEWPLTSFQTEGMECGLGVMHDIIVVNSELPHVESETESYGSSNKKLSQNLSNLVSSEDLIHAQPPEVSGTSSNPVKSVDTDYDESTDLPVQKKESTVLLDASIAYDCESAANVLPSSGLTVTNSQASMSDKNISSFCKSEEPLQGLPSATSVQVWTNGGLLGLEPSKPPDFSALNVESCNPVALAKDRDVHGLSSKIVLPKVCPNGSLRNLDAWTHEQVEKNLRSERGRERSPDFVNPHCRNRTQTLDGLKCSTLYAENQGNDMPEKNLLELVSAISESRFVKSEDSCPSSSLSNAHKCGFIEISHITPPVEQPVIPDVKNLFKEASQEDTQSSLSMLDLGQKLSANGVQRKGSRVHDDTSEPPGSIQIAPTKLEESHTIPRIGKQKVMHPVSPQRYPNAQLENGSPASSFSPSPPLEHMKISFHPLDSFETSKLKLKFPGGHRFHESIKDVMFPSFQLLPEPDILLPDIASDSENDTFCRSSSYMSEELMSPHSETSSRLWESGEISGSKDPKIYDALWRVSSAESISSGLELEGIDHVSGLCDSSFRSSHANNGLKSFQYDPLFDLPSFDSVASTSQQERICADPKDHQDSGLQYPNEPVPAPPPLPPVGWQVIQPEFVVAENEQGDISKVVGYPDDLHILGGSPSKQSTPAPPKLPQVDEVTDQLPRNKDQQKYGCREAGMVKIGKEMDGREDLLNQIRNKSFSLRRTAPARPTVMPESISTTNTKVAAILEKANAIRQAYVDSDVAGEDENWSEG